MEPSIYECIHRILLLMKTICHHVVLHQSKPFQLIRRMKKTPVPSRLDCAQANLITQLSQLAVPLRLGWINDKSTLDINLRGSHKVFFSNKYSQSSNQSVHVLFSFEEYSLLSHIVARFKTWIVLALRIIRGSKSSVAGDLLLPTNCKG